MNQHAPQEPPTPTSPTGQGQPAPADARPHRRWPVWRQVLAYIVLAGIAILAIWYIDRAVHQPQQTGFRQVR